MYKGTYLKKYLSEVQEGDKLEGYDFWAKYTNENHNDTQQLIANITGYSSYYEIFEQSCWGIDKEEFSAKNEVEQLKEIEQFRDVYELWEADVKQALRYLNRCDSVDFEKLTNKL